MEAAMFPKIATFRDMDARHASRPLAHAHANENRINARGAVVLSRSGPALVCHWGLTEGGKLECHWEIETPVGAEAEEPDGRRIIRRVA
jgi:hypothetical protein